MSMWNKILPDSVSKIACFAYVKRLRGGAEDVNAGIGGGR